MPSGAKKRKALKRKKQQEAIGTSTNDKRFSGDNLNGVDEHGSQEERESDSSFSSPGSQGNEEFGTKDPSTGQSSGMVKEASKKISGDADVTQEIPPKSSNAIAVETGTDQKVIVEVSSNSSSKHCAHTAKNIACGNSIMEIAPVVDSVSKVVILEKREIVDSSSTHSNLVKQKSEENEEHLSLGLEKHYHKVVTLPRSAAETSKNVQNIKESEGQVSSEENAIAVETGVDYQKTIVEISSHSSSKNRAHTSKNVACQDAYGNLIIEIPPAVDFVCKVVIPEKNESADTSTGSNLVKQKSDENEEHPSPGLEKYNHKMVTLPRSAADTSKKVERIKESKFPVPSEEKRPFLSGPPVIRKTSWLSCCGLFDFMKGSDR